MTSLLLGHGAEIDAKDFGGSSSMGIASQNGFFDGMKMMSVEAERRSDNEELV